MQLYYTQFVAYDIFNTVLFPELHGITSMCRARLTMLSSQSTESEHLKCHLDDTSSLDSTVRQASICVYKY